MYQLDCIGVSVVALLVAWWCYRIEQNLHNTCVDSMIEKIDELEAQRPILKKFVHTCSCTHTWCSALKNEICRECNSRVEGKPVDNSRGKNNG